MRPIAGLLLGTTAAGIKYPDRDDLVLIQLPRECVIASVFTRNRFCAAPIQVAQTHQQAAQPKYLLINTGYANAGLGEAGLAAAYATCQALADKVGCLPQAVLPFSTGVIGEALPVERVIDGYEACIEDLRSSGWEKAAAGIMTTDTQPKHRSTCVQLENQEVVVSGIAKGAGMICPNMATMLSFIATDQPMSPAVTQQLLMKLTNQSFNCISVDGDTSTNDAVVLISSHERKLPTINSDKDPRYQQIEQALGAVFNALAKDIVLDGEGATKCITIQVSGGHDVRSCEQVARTIAHSPLVKTALYAQDPNWGRILAAIGRAPVNNFNLNQVAISMNGLPVVVEGQRAASYDEASVTESLKNPEITVHIILGVGDSHFELITSDLSHEYVTINAEYRS